MSNDKSVIRNCSLGYACTCRWDDLKKLKNDNVRFCNTCQKEVYDCNSVEDLAESILLNRSVHIGENVFDEVENASVTHLTSGGWGQPQVQAKRNPFNPFDKSPMDFDDDIPF